MLFGYPDETGHVHDYWAYDKESLAEYHGLCTPNAVVRAERRVRSVDRPFRIRELDDMATRCMQRGYRCLGDAINGEFELAASVRGLASGDPKGDAARRVYEHWLKHGGKSLPLTPPFVLPAAVPNAPCYW